MDLERTYYASIPISKSVPPGHPLPVVSWLKNDMCVDEAPDYVITYNNGECMLRFEEVFMEDSAGYRCRARNDLGEDETSTRMEVTGQLVATGGLTPTLK